jgi:hypothetical protein
MSDAIGQTRFARQTCIPVASATHLQRAKTGLRAVGDRRSFPFRQATKPAEIAIAGAGREWSASMVSVPSMPCS